MFETKNNYNGAAFDYENETSTCRANGEFRFEETNLVNVRINGSIVKEGVTYLFNASRDASGHLSTDVDYPAIRETAAEVATILERIESLNYNAE